MKKFLPLVIILFAINFAFGQYLTEDFESAFTGTPPAPTGWTQTRIRTIYNATYEKDWVQNTWTGAAWTLTGGTTPTTGAYSGTGVAWIDDYNYMNSSTPQAASRLESPVVDLSSSTSPYLRFWYFNNQGVGITLNLRVMVSTDGGSTWDVLTPVVNGFTVTTLTWNQVSVAIPAAYRTAGFKFAFELTNRWGTNNPFIDLVTVEEFTPTTITSAATGDWNVGATWVGGAVPTADNDVVIAAGHTVTVTNAASTTGIIGRCQNLTINSTGILAHGLGTANLLHVFGNVVVNGTLNAFNGTSGRTLFVGGNFTVNIGGVATFNTATTQQSASAPTTITTGASTLIWLGNQAATFTNSGTLTGGRINNILHLNPGGITYNSAVGVPFTVGLYLGAVNPNSNLTLGNAAAASTTQIVIRANGTFTSNPIWSNTNMTARANYYYSPNWVPLTQSTLTTGNEIEVIATVRTVSGAFTMNTHNNLQLTYPLTLGVTGTSGSWALTRGIVITDATNLITTTSFISTSTGTAPSTVTPPTTHGSYIAGPLRRTFAASGTTSRVFPLGVGTGFNGATPNSNVLKSMTLAPGAGASQSPTISIEAAPSGTVGSPLTTVMGTRAYRINLNGGPDFPGTATFTMTGMNYTYGNSDNLIGNQDQMRIAQATALSGTWSERSVTSGFGTFVDNTVYSRTSSTAAPGPIAPLATYGEYFCWATTAAVMSYSSSTLTQNTNVTTPGATNQNVIGIQVVTTGALNPLNVTKFTVNANGTTAIADILNARIYYTGTSSTFATTNQFGPTTIPTIADFDITDTRTLATGTNYFWLTFDIASGATLDNVVDGECTVVTVGGSDYIPSPTTAPTGNRLIKGPLSGDYTIGTAKFNQISGKNIYFEKSVQKIMKEVWVEIIEEEKQAEISVEEKQANINETSVKSSGEYQLMEVEEITWIPMENGKPYTGPLSVYKSENPNLNFPKGSKGVYLTITAAVAELNMLGVSGAVNFLLTDATYPSETFPIVINQFAGSSSSNTVTFKPDAGVTSVITGGTATSVFALNGCDYVIIDGSNLVGGTTKNLTISNTYTGGSFNFAVGLYHNGVKGATNSTVKNCIIKGTPTVTSSYGLFLNAGGGSFHNTSFINNTIKNAKIGIQFAGVTGSVTNNGLISGNIIGDASEPLKQGGIICSYVNNTTITGNEIFGEALGNSNSSQYGILLIAGSTNSKIRKNTIHDFYYTSTTGYGCFGINYNSDATTVTEVSNNVIYNIKADGDQNSYTNANYVPSGIYIKTGGNVQVYYNSIYMSGNTLGKGTTYPGISACLSMESGITALDIRNNVFQNSMGSYPGSTMTNRTYGVVSYSANTAFTDINYNDYFINGINPFIGYIGATNISDLAAWKIATGKDAFSISADPLFTSTSNLFPQSGSPVISAGTPIGGVIIDITGAPRSATAPTMGAYEIATLTWTGTTDSDWHTSTNWSPTGIPFASTSVIIPASLTNYPTLSAAGACYSLYMESDASLLDNGYLTMTNATSGVTVERTMTCDVLHSYSPSVSGATAGIFHLPGSTGLDVYLYGYNELNNANADSGYFNIIPLNTALIPMSGYSVYPDGANATPPQTEWTFLQIGGLNTSTFGTTNNITKTGVGANAGLNYLGNPYPSYIDWTSASGWTKTNVDATIYTENSGTWAQYTTPGPGVNGGSNIVAPGQGFFVRANSAAGTVMMNNNVRTHTLTPYLKDAVTDYIKLAATGYGKTDETVIRFESNATPLFDGQFDGVKLSPSDESYPQIYSISDRRLAYNALPETEMVQLGFKAGIDGEYQISATDIADISDVWLEDTFTGINTDLTTDSYDFVYSVIDETNRFILHFTPLAVPENFADMINIYASYNDVYVSVPANTDGDIVVYNLMGQEVARTVIKDVLNKITLNKSAYYVVKVLSNENVVTKKVFVK